ncbi:hypothetical protein WJX77_004737 [Trebouxia sp. C0004]
MTSQPVAYSSSSNIFKHTPGLGLAGRRIQSRVNSSKRRLSDLHEKEDPRPVNTTDFGAVNSSAIPVPSPTKRGRRSLFEECQERLACNSGASEQSGSGVASLSQRLTQQGKQQQEPTSMDSTFSAVTQSMPNTDKTTAAASFSSEYRDMPCTEAGKLQGAIQFGSDPAEVTSPVKRTPMPEVPANDGFHRTFQPFDMLRSPTSLGGNSFQDLNAHLAQNARLSIRQRSLRCALRTATKEYVPADEPALREPEVVATVRAAPDVEGPAQPVAARPLMVAVSRGGVVNSTTLVSRSQGSGFISINRLPEAASQSSQGVSIRRCIF